MQIFLAWQHRSRQSERRLIIILTVSLQIVPENKSIAYYQMSGRLLAVVFRGLYKRGRVFFLQFRIKIYKFAS